MSTWDFDCESLEAAAVVATIVAAVAGGGVLVPVAWGAMAADYEFGGWVPGEGLSCLAGMKSSSQMGATKVVFIEETAALSRGGEI
jgi:hypothetical protein